MAMAITMRKALSESAAAALKLGNPVRIVSGEQNGITGKVHGISGSSISVFPDLDAIVPIEVPFANVRLHLRPGEFIRVKAGPQAGRMGWVVNVEYKADEDIVTFVDDKMAESERVVTLLQREMRVLPIEGPQEVNVFSQT
jgi:transcription elongation factor